MDDLPAGRQERNQRIGFFAPVRSGAWGRSPHHGIVKGGALNEVFFAILLPIQKNGEKIDL